jgi:hypothetical protein
MADLRDDGQYSVESNVLGKSRRYAPPNDAPTSYLRAPDGDLKPQDVVTYARTPPNRERPCESAAASQWCRDTRGLDLAYEAYYPWTPGKDRRSRQKNPSESGTSPVRSSTAQTPSGPSTGTA